MVGTATTIGARLDRRLTAATTMARAGSGTASTALGPTQHLGEGRLVVQETREWAQGHRHSAPERTGAPDQRSPALAARQDHPMGVR